MIAGLVLAVCALMASVQAPEVTVHLIGDSTMADKPYESGNPEKGWGQVFPLYFSSGVRIENHAVNGRSTKSFIDEGRWEKVLTQVRPGDYVFIEFGHNDSKVHDAARYADADSAYRENLEKFVMESRKAGAVPVLLTPIVRRKFDASGQLVDTHGRYPAVVRETALATGTVLIDLEQATARLLTAWGPERSEQLFLHIEPGEYPVLPGGLEDNTHLSAVGAFRVCDLVVEEIRTRLPELGRYLNP